MLNKTPIMKTKRFTLYHDKVNWKLEIVPHVKGWQAEDSISESDWNEIKDDNKDQIDEKIGDLIGFWG
jgi:hypothetical protein